MKVPKFMPQPWASAAARCLAGPRRRWLQLLQGGGAPAAQGCGQGLEPWGCTPCALVASPLQARAPPQDVVEARVLQKQVMRQLTVCAMITRSERRYSSAAYLICGHCIGMTQPGFVGLLRGPLQPHLCGECKRLGRGLGLATGRRPMLLYLQDNLISWMRRKSVCLAYASQS